MTRITRNAISPILVLFFFAPVCQAQSNYATLKGTVLDPQDKAVPGASIQLIAVGTNAARQVTSNEDGVFQITGLLPGPYKLDVTASGFAALTENVQLEVGQQMNLNLHLKLSSLSGTVDIMADAVNILRTTDASVGEVVESTAVRNLPL